MFFLNWMKSAGRVAYWLFGVGVLVLIARSLDGYLKSRAVKKSNSQAQKDEASARSKIERAEADWNESGEKNDQKN